MTKLSAHLLPDSAEVGPGGELSVGGCSVGDLAHEYGTPLYIYDEAHLRARCRESVDAFGGGATYAAKAFLCVAMARLVHEEGMLLDVASAGEMHIALVADVPPEKLVFHGNNKSVEELRQARRSGVGRTVIDSFDELDRLELLHEEDGLRPDVFVRVTPGIGARTHDYLRTGQTDSKFGFGIGGEAAIALERCARSSAVELVGLHSHLGSQLFEPDPYVQAVALLASFVERFAIREISLGGGFGVAYTGDQCAPTFGEWAATIRHACELSGIVANVLVEPGRSIVAQACLTVYSIGTIKQIPDVRTYLSVDGGMSDNLRPSLYGSEYESFLPRAPFADRTKPMTIAGKHCESGDVLIWDGLVPNDAAVGDLLATPVTGAYGHSMASNYNAALRPPVLFVRDGKARVVVRREVLSDLTTRDVL